MATGSWLKTHRKQITIHTLIVAGFLVFLHFLAEPLFDKLQSTTGISLLWDISLPSETDNIMYGLTRGAIDNGTIQLDGWAFVEGHGAENKDTFIVLKSDERVYVFDTVDRRRSDIAHKFDRPDLTWSGFMAVIPSEEIRSGDYFVGFYIRGDDAEALEFTDYWVLRKSAREVHLAL